MTKIMEPYPGKSRPLHVPVEAAGEPLGVEWTTQRRREQKIVISPPGAHQKSLLELTLSMGSESGRGRLVERDDNPDELEMLGR